MSEKMGSKRNTVTVGGVAVQDKKVEGETSTETKSIRVGSTAVTKERPATKRRLKGSRPGRNPLWFLNHEDELALVTCEASNDALGIKEIKVFDPSENQWNNGTVAVVQLETIIGQVKGLQVCESTRDDSGSLYVRAQSRSWEKDGQKQYMNDLILDNKINAQILSYVNSLLEEEGAEEEKA